MVSGVVFVQLVLTLIKRQKQKFLVMPQAT